MKDPVVRFKVLDTPMADVNWDEESNPYAAPNSPLSDVGPKTKTPPSVPLPVALTGCGIQAAGWLMMLYTVSRNQWSPVNEMIALVGFVMVILPGFYFLSKRVRRIARSIGQRSEVKGKGTGSQDHGRSASPHS
jgi:hypothetical protein